ncbi:MAG: hypothetical protein ACK5H1_09485 [Tenacibaculum sp.]
MDKLSLKHPTFGVFCMQDELKELGHLVNHKRVRRQKTPRNSENKTGRPIQTSSLMTRVFNNPTPIIKPMNKSKVRVFISILNY